MSRLDELNWDNGNGLDELIAWGITPIRALVKGMHVFFDVYDDTEEMMNLAKTLAYEIEDKIDEIDACLDRFMNEMDRS